MYFCHVACMIWVCVVVSLGSFRCTWDAGSASVAAKVEMALTNFVVGRVFLHYVFLRALLQH
jgi:hypothetical protein